MPELSAGTLALAAFEVGEEDRGERSGWVNVTFSRSLVPYGLASVGPRTAGGLIRLKYIPEIDAASGGNPWRCESEMVGVADHEIVHTMGYFHTSSTASDFPSGPSCTGVGRPESWDSCDVVFALPDLADLDQLGSPPTTAWPVMRRRASLRILAGGIPRPPAGDAATLRRLRAVLDEPGVLIVGSEVPNLLQLPMRERVAALADAIGGLDG